MAEALQYVHAQEFIHRDVCPRNFIYESETGNVKLIDFGLSLPARKEFMQPGNRTGTPLYMAPEVVRRRWTDQRLDIFATGRIRLPNLHLRTPLAGHRNDRKGRPGPRHADPSCHPDFRPTLNGHWATPSCGVSSRIRTTARRPSIDFLNAIRPVAAGRRVEFGHYQGGGVATGHQPVRRAGKTARLAVPEPSASRLSIRQRTHILWSFRQTRRAADT